MKTLAEFMIISDAVNRPSMFEKSLFDSCKSRMELFIENRENGRMILDSVLNGLLDWRTVVQEDGTTRKKTYAKLSATEKIQADCDLKATNIVLQGLPPDVYAIVNHHKVAKEIWDRVKLLMQGTKLSLQKRNINYMTSLISEGHMARQCTQPKRPRNATWFKENAMLAEALEARQILDEEQLAFITIHAFSKRQVTC
ncbi:hypothetical protein Tco_0386456 [Tanacetum coccineum]